MSASEKLKALEDDWASGELERAPISVFDVLPQIRAVMEAVEAVRGELWQSGTEEILAVPLDEWLPVRRTLTALDEALP